MCYVSKRVMRSRVGQLRCLARLYVWHCLGTDEGTRVTDDTLSATCRSNCPSPERSRRKKLSSKTHVQQPRGSKAAARSRVSGPSIAPLVVHIVNSRYIRLSPRATSSSSLKASSPTKAPPTHLHLHLHLPIPFSQTGNRRRAASHPTFWPRPRRRRRNWG